MATDRSNWPVIVRLGLRGLPSRVMAWTFFWLSIASSLGCVAYGFVDRRFFVGGVFVLAAPAYYLCIRWVDRNSTWA